MSQQGKNKAKKFAGLLYITKKRKFSCVRYAYSQSLCSQARFDLVKKRGMHQPVQPHTYARLLLFNATIAQPDFAVVKCSDLVMSVFYSPALTRSLTFLQLSTAVSKAGPYPIGLIASNPAPGQRGPRTASTNLHTNLHFLLKVLVCSGGTGPACSIFWTWDLLPTKTIINCRF